jgi:hypothetical protein
VYPNINSGYNLSFLRLHYYKYSIFTISSLFLKVLSGNGKIMIFKEEIISNHRNSFINSKHIFEIYLFILFIFILFFRKDNVPHILHKIIYKSKNFIMNRTRYMNEWLIWVNFSYTIHLKSTYHWYFKTILSKGHLNQVVIVFKDILHFFG